MDGTTFRFSRTVIPVLSGLAIFFVLLNVAAYFTGSTILSVFFYLGSDSSFPCWYSSFVLLLACLLLGLIGLQKKAKNESYWRHWLLLSVIFAGMSIDEVARIHEIIGGQILLMPIRETIIESISIVPGSNHLFFYPWVLIGIPFVIIVFLAYIKFLLNLPPQIRFLFFLSGGIFVAGALGLEMLAARNASLTGEGNTMDVVLTGIEESLEMLGMIIFIHALLLYIERHTSGFQIVIGKNPKSDLQSD